MVFLNVREAHPIEGPRGGKKWLLILDCGHAVKCHRTNIYAKEPPTKANCSKH